MVVVFAISCPSICNGGGGGHWNQLCVLQAKLKGLLIWSNWDECAARTSCRKGCLTRSPKECWTYSFSLEDTPLAALWALVTTMNACSHLFVCKGVNQQRSSKSALFLATAVCWCSSKFFCTYVGQKPEVPRSFFFLQCAGVLWGLVAFCGCWDGRSLFCHRTSCPMGEALSLVCKTQVLHNSVQWLEARILPGPHLFRGSGVFWGRGCGLEVASDLLRTSGKSIGAVIFYHHHLQQHQYLKKT